MASWKDGAAYAPTERPHGFATPRAEPLPSSEPWTAPTPGPMAAPAGFDATPQPPLAQLAAGSGPSRDPRDSFTVTSAALAPGPVAGAKRDPREPILTSAPQPVGREWASAMGSQLPAPTGPPLPPPGELLEPLPPRPAQQSPPPGQMSPRRAQPGPAPQRPAPQYPAPQAPGPVQRPAPQQRQLAYIAAGLCFLGFVLPPMSPFVLTAAGALGLRTQSLTGSAGSSALAVGLATLGWQLLTDSLGNASVVGMLASVGFTIAFVVGALKAR